MADRVTREANKKQKEEKKAVSSGNQPSGKYLVQNIQGKKEFRCRVECELRQVRVHVIANIQNGGQDTESFTFPNRIVK